MERRTSAALRAAGLELVGWGWGGGAGALPRRVGGRGAAAIGSESEREGGEGKDGEREGPEREGRVDILG